MRKIIATAVVLMALGLLATACSKMKATSLIGTYTKGKATMTVSGNGEVSFSSNGEGGIADSFDGIYASLKNWDLTTEKKTYEYSFTEEGTDSGSGSNYTINVSLKFTKDKETVDCEANIKLPAAYGQSGTVTFSK